ncbi:MAG: hypothetical protein OK456_04750 [Thaumarchaeota archaeon]|nr:hypothetical protein [Nitrososphaerota archaeon]
MLLGVATVAVVIIGFVLLVPRGGPAQSNSTTTPSGVTSTTSAPSSKPIILYINQGNGVVNQSNFGALLAFASSQGFNTLFFQVYRQGDLLFTPSQLTSFVAQAHDSGLKIFFSLYITDPSQQLPTSIYPLGEDGVSLDMSSLTVSSQQSFYSDLSDAYGGTKAITTDDMTLPLSPNLLVLETYGTQYQQFIHPGIVAGVEAVQATSKSDYQQQFQYALANSDGVMVFDYAGLLKTGY